MQRLPLNLPLSNAYGATPTNAATCLRLIVPSSGSSAISVQASTSPTPGIEVSNRWRCASAALVFAIGAVALLAMMGPALSAEAASKDAVLTLAAAIQVPSIPALTNFDISYFNPAGEYQDFVVGFTAGQQNVWGRPVDVAFAHDGSLLFSDDRNGVVYRVTYKMQ
jgi:hypothetical protein